MCSDQGADEPGGGPRGKYRDAGCGFEGATKDMLGRRQIVIGEVRDPKTPHIEADASARRRS
jgi:hypothetical protein